MCSSRRKLFVEDHHAKHKNSEGHRKPGKTLPLQTRPTIHVIVLVFACSRSSTDLTA